MARVLLTARYEDLDPWPGLLFEAYDDTIFLVSSATSYAFELGVSSEFAGYTVTFSGSGFTYDSGAPTGGKATKVVVRDGGGNLILTIDKLTGIASDLSQIVSDIFGSDDGNSGPGPSGKVAWSHLLVGNDTILGTNGDDDRPRGYNDGNDTFIMKGGNDDVYTGAGRDKVFGGADFDTLRFEDTTFNEGTSAFRGISVNMKTGKLTDCWGDVDTFTGIERVVGSRFNDLMIGSAKEDEFDGLRGRDTLDGGAGADRLNYSDDYWNGGRRGIDVDLQTSVKNGNIFGRVIDGFGQRDTVINFEYVWGTRYNDTFRGSGKENRFQGGEGEDFYDGRGGFDLVFFFENFGDVDPTQGVQVNLSLSSGQIINDGYGNTETAKNIEGISGWENDDTLAGSGRDEFFEGGEGQDLLTGGGGNDEFYWHGDFAIGQGDVVTDFSATGANTRDKLVINTENFEGMNTTLRLVNGSAATTNRGTFIYDASDDTLYWDKDGTGASARVAVVTLTGVASLSAANFDLF
jgi:serralysin